MTRDGMFRICGLDHSVELDNRKRSRKQRSFSPAMMQATSLVLNCLLIVAPFRSEGCHTGKEEQG